MAEYRVQHFGPGESANEFQPGDFILTHRKRFISRLIRLAQKIRGRERKYSYWSHAAIIIDTEGTLVEAETKG
ncbi:MAG: hypothetical protein M3Z13_02685, partial [Candidatus Dormibacteraeota bacterium]|nr:hypothetical protein [Candidatus Dormibacteraeota bacterium]